MWIVYTGGRGPKGTLLLVQIALTPNPEKHLAELIPTQPYPLENLGIELGDPDTFEERKATFRRIGLQNGWYLARPELLEFVQKLPEPDRGLTKFQRICIEFSPSDFAAIGAGVERLGTVTKTRLIRRAVQFYLALSLYKAKGWTVQAIRQGKFFTFPDLDDIPDPPEV